jgi:energy-coupling factor transporter ATP-binding protein EcfA2
MRPAQTIIEIYSTVNPDEALPPDDPRFVNLTSARGDDDFISIIARRIINTPTPNYQRILFTGHRGSGKSTELLRLKKNLADAKFLVAYLDVGVTLDLADVEYLDVLVAIARQVEETARGNGIKIQARLLDDISKWFADVTEIQEDEFSSALDVTGESGVGVEIPFLAKILASVTSQIRSGSSSRKEIRRKLEQNVSILVERINLMIMDVAERGKDKGFKGLAVIADSMEKIPLQILNEHTGVTNHSLLFVEHAEQLKSLKCHLVMTVPVSLAHDRNLKISFSELEILPMVRVFHEDGQPDDEGVNLLREVVARRLNIQALFEDEALVDQLIQASGGVARDLMHLLLSLADYTLDGKISDRQAKRAIAKLQREYDRLIRDSDIKFLSEVEGNSRPPKNSEIARLMYNRLILPYRNGEEWMRLHPAVAHSPTFRRAQG